MPDTSSSSIAKTRRPGYPLGVLFLLIAAAASLLGLVTIVLGDRVWRMSDLPENALVVAGFSSAGMCLGAFLGLFHYRRLLGCVFGGVTGTVVGGLAGPLLVAEESHAGPLFTVALVGSVLLVGIGLAIRQTQRKRPTTTSIPWHQETVDAEVIEPAPPVTGADLPRSAGS